MSEDELHMPDIPPEKERQWTKEDLAELERLEAENEKLKSQIEAHKKVHGHLKNILLVKVHELVLECLRLESAQVDPTKLVGI